MLDQKINKKFFDCNEKMLFKYPFYAEIFLKCNIQETERVPTMGVNTNAKGFNFYYNNNFVNELDQTEINFVVIHEIYHLLFDHPSRSMNYDISLSNIAQDMIINSIIARSIDKNWATMPKDKKTGQNSGLFIPKEYTGVEVFEKLYEWLDQKKQERKQQQQQQGQGQGQSQQGQGNGKPQPQQEQSGSEEGEGEENKNGQSGQKQQGQGKGKGQPKNEKQDGQGQEQGQGQPQQGKGNGKPDYGPYGKDNQDMISLDKILDELANDDKLGQTIDQHIKDEIPAELKKQMVEDVINGLKARGLVSGDIEEVLNNLRKKRKDYLREIKQNVSDLKGFIKDRTWNRPSRRGRWGVKGTKKNNSQITVLLDTSGSMHGYFDKIISYIFQNDIMINLVQCDAEVHAIEKIKNKKQLLKMKIKGLGGTVLQPGVDYIKKNFPKQNLCILTDGLCDNLNFSGFNGKVLILTTDTEVQHTGSGKVKQIVIQKDPEFDA